jgi:Bacterial regulatory protein, arsR family
MGFGSQEPQYDKAMAQPNRMKIVKAIAEADGAAKFSTISKMTGVKDNNLLHHLNILIGYGIIEQIADGPYTLKYKTPLCFIFGQRPDKEKVSYIGLLGERNERQEAETAVALQLLKRREKIDVGLAYVVTSTAAAQSWKDSELPVQWILCDGEAITDIDKIKRKVQDVLTDLIKEHLVIMDCTSFNKPATIAMYGLAQTYLVPLIYVYEPLRKLKWLISRQHLSQRFV